jgi:nickel-dependent lactate racemase
VKVRLPYGRGELFAGIPGGNVTVIEPVQVPGLADERAAFTAAVRRPIGGAPLRGRIGAGDRVAVVIPDITRALPTDRLLGWLLEELGHVPLDRFTIVNGTGSHRANSPEELDSMIGADLARRVTVVNHDAHDPATMERVGAFPGGGPVFFNREYVQADRRIVLGFIEPHLMAGFSGGYKGVFPALADIASIMRYHGAAIVGDPRSTWGRLDGNPTQELIRANGSLLPVDFLVNVTLNRGREITRFFCGDPAQAHAAGCAFARSAAMAACPRRFPIVVTTNSGHPLDQNLYQTVKGMSAASQIVEEGGFILTVARCEDGFPSHGNFRRLLFEHPSPRALLDAILAPGFSVYDQWEAQILASILLKARVGLHSELPPREVERAHLEPVADITARLGAELERTGRDGPVAVMPEGPMTIPYVA